MVASRFRWLPRLAAALALCVAGLRAQTVIWTGTSTNTNFENGANYQGGTAPNTSGDDTVDLNSGAGPQITISNAADIYGFYLPGPSGYFYIEQSGGGTLTIGAGGISLGESTSPVLFIYVPVILSANQTWNGSTSAFIYDSGGLSGSGQLTVQGRIYMVGAGSYTGGTVVSSNGTVFIGNSTALGTGPLLVQNDASVQSWSGQGNVVLANATTLADNADFATDAPTDPLTFGGNVTEQVSGATLTIGSSAAVVFQGALAGPASSALTFDGTSALLPQDGGSLAVLEGGTSGIGGLTINGMAVILNPTGNPTTAFAGIANANLRIESGGYLGLSGSFTTSGAVSSFLSSISSIGNNVYGSIGLDSYGSGTNTFTDNVDESSFTSESFLGLGSATSALLTGTITPVNGFYKFGGGGGTLTVASSLTDFDGSTGIIMEAAAAPVTVKLTNQGNSYTGQTQAYGGVLVFDAPINSGAGSFYMNGGYVGYVPADSNKTTAAFVGLFNTGFQNGVIGFDAPSGNTAQVTDNIDLSVFGEGTVFLGSSTSAELSGTITPNSSGYMFTGVKGGTLQVDSNLSGANALTIGLSDPIESNASQSTVILTGDNSQLTGAVTFNSGVLQVAQDAALGTGTVTVPDVVNSPAQIAPTLENQGASITLPNNFVINNFNTQNAGLIVGSTTAEGTLTLSGVISDGSSGGGVLGIQGPVALTGANTYSGQNIDGNQIGTIFQGNGDVTPTAYVNNSASFGAATAGIELNVSANIVPLANVTIPNPITLNYNTLTVGAQENDFTLTLSGALQGGGTLQIESSVDLPNANPNFFGEVLVENAVVTIGNELALGTGELVTQQGTVQFGFTNPTIENLSGDENSVINLAEGSTLTLDTPTTNTQYYYGEISGDSATSVVKTGPGTEYLSNNNNTWGAGTTVSAGTLVAGGSTALGSGAITVNGGATLATDTGAVLANDLVLQNGATLGGYGTFAPAGAITLASGTTIQPGSLVFNSGIGTLAIGSGGLILGGGGGYSLSIANAGGTAGTDYGTVTVGGAVNITALPSDPFVISLVSINPGTNQAGLANFSPTSSYAWTILSANSITSFSAADFAFTTTSFQNGLGGGLLTIQQQGANLVVDFTPVPEPATWALVAAGGALAGWAALRRRRA